MTLHDALMDVDENFDNIHDFVQNVDAETLADRNIPLPPSLGCGNAANQTQGNQMQVVEGHNPFPDDLLSGVEIHTYAEWEVAEGGGGDTRAHVLDTYTKTIRDDVPRIQKRDTPFINYLQLISIEPLVHPPVQQMHFGRQKMSPFKVIVRSLRRFLGL
jgi:hypothetical protein